MAGPLTRETILLNGQNQGRYEEGTITDTSLPGTIMEVVPATADIGGRPSFRASSITTGNKRPICILLEDELQGKRVFDAYVAGTRCRVYYPTPGEDMQLLVQDVSGTADSHAIGDLLGITNAGLGHSNSSYASTPFQVMEAVAEGSETGNTLIYCRFVDM